jgi:hypothetical protein
MDATEFLSTQVIAAVQPLMQRRLSARAQNMKFSLFSKSAKAVLCARAGRNGRKRQNTAYPLVEGFRIDELTRCYCV